MKNALIFAYGSNMNARQMAIRCPGSRIVGVARLNDHRLVFTGWNARWGGGVATLVPARRSSVVGVVWRLSEENLERLDGFEGYPFVYDRIAVEVGWGKNRKALWCYTYVKTDDVETSEPSPEYLRTILDGYATAGAAVPTKLKRLYHQVSLGIAA